MQGAQYPSSLDQMYQGVGVLLDMVGSTPRRLGRVPCEIVGEESIDVFFERLDNALDHRPLHDRVHVEKLARQHLSHETSQHGRRLHGGLRAASLSEYVRSNNNNN